MSMFTRVLEEFQNALPVSVCKKNKLIWDYGTPPSCLKPENKNEPFRKKPINRIPATS